MMPYTPNARNQRYSRRPVSPAGTVRCVREYSELATLRPSPLRLRCVPFRERVLQPISQILLQCQERLRIRDLLAQMSRELNRSQSAMS